MKRFLLVAALLLCCPTVWGRELNVPSEDYNSIQSAIDDANAGDVVIVSAGTYQENINFPEEAITVRSTDPNDPNVVAATIIDGSAPVDPNYGSVVTFSSGEDANSVLSGFTITGGTGSWILVSWEFKGLRWNRCGGGVLCYNLSAPTIKDNVLVNNSAGQGGGIYIYGDPVNPSDPSNPSVHVSPVIIDNTFVNNSADTEHGFAPPDTNYPANDHGDGGAIVGFQGCDPIIRGNLIRDNNAQAYGGGLHLRQWSNGVVENNQFIDNSSLIGAGIHVTYSSSPLIIGNLIEDHESSSGAAIYVYYLSEPLIIRNRVHANWSLNGIIGVHYGSGGQITNNMIYENSGGAGIILTGSSPWICNNTIVKNERSGIVCNSTSAPTIENNIIALTQWGYGIDGGADANPAIRYNNVWGNQFGGYGPNIGDQTGVEGNISVDPQFLDSDGADYHLTVYSQCMDAGDNNALSPESILDIDNESRLSTVDPNEDPVVDMGADEVVFKQADFDTSGRVDYQDVSVLVDEWLTEGTDLRSDFTSDDFVNFDDYAGFAPDWLWEAPWHTENRESALQFDSASDGHVWIYTPEDSILNNVFTFTYSAWIYPLDSQPVSTRILCKNERAFMISGKVLKGYSHGGGIPYSVSVTNLLELGEWQLVMMTYDYYNGDKKIDLYHNGQEVDYQVHTVGTEARPPLLDWMAEGQWDLVIGSAAWDPGTYIPDAIIDEVAIYDRVLTQQEIDFLYNNGLGRPTPPSLNPIGLWHFDENQGVVVLDSSGNNNHGVLQGVSWPTWVDGKFLKY
ncbi:MAG: right-handed parallel beta-helix repeat-containing protein [Planctomycetota bacterium]|jgi:parallel beta-helix repeat protein